MYEGMEWDERDERAAHDADRAHREHEALRGWAGGVYERAGWSEDVQRDWDDAERELREQGYRERLTSYEVFDVVAQGRPAGIDMDSRMHVNPFLGMAPTDLARDALANERRMGDRARNGLDIDDNREQARLYSQARDALN